MGPSYSYIGVHIQSTFVNVTISFLKANKGIVVSYIPDAFRFSFKIAVIFLVWGFSFWTGAALVKENHLSRNNLCYVFFTILLATYSAVVLSYLPQDTDEGIKSAIKMNDIIEYPYKEIVFSQT